MITIVPTWTFRKMFVFFLEITKKYLMAGFIKYVALAVLKLK